MSSQRVLWPLAALQPQFFWIPIPAQTFVLLLLFLLHARLWTLGLLIGAICFLLYLKYRRRRLSWLIRRIRSLMRGGVVQSRPVWYWRRVLMKTTLDKIDIKKY